MIASSYVTFTFPLRHQISHRQNQINMIDYFQIFLNMATVIGVSIKKSLRNQNVVSLVNKFKLSPQRLGSMTDGKISGTFFILKSKSI